MTAIATKVYKDRVEIAADQQTTWGNNKLSASKPSLYEDGNKIFQDQGMTIGVSGRVRDGNFLKIFIKNHKPKHASEDDVLDFMSEFIDWAKKKDTSFTLESHIILVYESKVFQIIYLDVKEVKDYSAVGSGMFLCLGAMYMGATPEKAIEVAKEYDLYCGGETQKVSIRKI